MPYLSNRTFRNAVTEAAASGREMPPASGGREILFGSHARYSAVVALGKVRVRDRGRLVINAVDESDPSWLIRLDATAVG